MIVKFIKTGVKNNIDFEFFKCHLSHCAKEFEFVSGTKEEKKLFSEEVEASKSFEEQLLME